MGCVIHLYVSIEPSKWILYFKRENRPVSSTHRVKSYIFFKELRF